MVAFCDHQADFAAEKNRAGIAYLDLENKELALEQIHESLIEMQKQNVDCPILSLHWGPNMVERPSEKFQEIAHQAIDFGFKMLFGHSAHTFHGVEIYRDCPIIYAAGDLVDDYAVDPYFKNDHQLLFELVLDGTEIKHLILYPVFIDYCKVKPANDSQYKWIAEKITQHCAELNTEVKCYDDPNHASTIVLLGDLRA